MGEGEEVAAQEGGQRTVAAAGEKPCTLNSWPCPLSSHPTPCPLLPSLLPLPLQPHLTPPLLPLHLSHEWQQLARRKTPMALSSFKAPSLPPTHTYPLRPPLTQPLPYLFLPSPSLPAPKPPDLSHEWQQLQRLGQVTECLIIPPPNGTQGLAASLPGVSVARLNVNCGAEVVNRT